MAASIESTAIMESRTRPAPPAAATLTDEEVVARVRAGEVGLFEVLMRRYNQRLYRVARAILGDDSEAEDVMQDAYVRAFSHLDQFAGRARFSTWLTRIAVYEALARARRRRRTVEIDAMDHTRSQALPGLRSAERSPEQQVIDQNLKAVLESAIERLSESHRSVLVLRDIESLSTAETAACLGVSEAVVKTRLHRGRALLRRELAAASAGVLQDAFSFHLSRCDRVVAAVFRRIGAAAAGGAATAAGAQAPQTEA
jgi:RNA polymerase sigma-70 factor (ECF subfamily)